MARSEVAIVRTSPQTVLADHHRLMNLADYQSYLPKDKDTALKINISWHFFYPACSTTPWQLEGVIRAMKKDGYDPNLIHGCHNRTVVIDSHSILRYLDANFRDTGPRLYAEEREEMQAIVDEAHTHGRKVAAHAHGIERAHSGYEALLGDPDVEAVVGLIWYGHPEEVPQTRTTAQSAIGLVHS